MTALQQIVRLNISPCFLCTLIIKCLPGWRPEPPPPPPPLIQDTLLNPSAYADTIETDIFFRNIPQDLKNDSDNRSDTSEHVWLYEKPPGGYLIDTFSGPHGQRGINIDLPFPVSGIAHNHFINSLSIYSPEDLWTICTASNLKLMKDSSKFTFPLVTAQSTQYLLMIENLTKF
jgi:hypothetical protein